MDANEEAAAKHITKMGYSVFIPTRYNGAGDVDTVISDGDKGLICDVKGYSGNNYINRGVYGVKGFAPDSSKIGGKKFHYDNGTLQEFRNQVVNEHGVVPAALWKPSEGKSITGSVQQKSLYGRVRAGSGLDVLPVVYLFTGGKIRNDTSWVQLDNVKYSAAVYNSFESVFESEAVDIDMINRGIISAGMRLNEFTL